MDWTDIFIRAFVTACVWIALDRLILAGKSWRGSKMPAALLDKVAA